MPTAVEVLLPAFLGYGRKGRRYAPSDETLKFSIPPANALIFDVELVAIFPCSLTAYRTIGWDETEHPTRGKK